MRLRPHIDALFRELGHPRPRGVPAMRFPSTIDDEDAEGRWRDFRDQGFNTAFAFPFDPTLSSTNAVRWWGSCWVSH